MISIIIPTYNESKNITDLVVRINRCLSRNYELIIVDDGSPDGTGLLAEELAQNYPIKVIHRRQKLGLASAVIEGFKAGCGELLCVMDSDLSHPPEIIPLLLEKFEDPNTDLVVASRFAKGGGIKNWPKKRLLSTYLAIATVRPLTKVKDPMSGFFILKRNVIHEVKLIPRGFKILLEILVKGKYKGVEESPFVFIDRVHGVSKLNLKVYQDFIAQLCDLYFYRLRMIFRIQQ